MKEIPDHIAHQLQEEIEKLDILFQKKFRCYNTVTQINILNNYLISLLFFSFIEGNYGDDIIAFMDSFFENSRNSTHEAVKYFAENVKDV